MHARRPRIFVLLPTMPPPTNYVLAILRLYEGFTLIECMCMQCKEAQDLVLLTTMPPPTLRVEFLRELI